jgi:quercetin dioxygenase-like cupin family protein
MQVVRIFTGADQQSHFEEIKLSFAGDPTLLTTEPQAAKMIAFRSAPPGTVLDWHPAPRRQYVITLSGQWDIVCGDGTTRRFKPGDVMLADDLTGQGHQSRVVGNEPHVFITVPLTELTTTS